MHDVQGAKKVIVLQLALQLDLFLPMMWFILSFSFAFFLDIFPFVLYCWPFPPGFVGFCQTPMSTLNLVLITEYCK